METTKHPALPRNASMLTRLKLGVEALKVLQFDAGHPFYGPLLNVCLDTEKYERILSRLRESEEGQRILKERPSLQGPELDLATFEAMPAGTLGHEFARYFRDNKISPFVTTFEVSSDFDYLSKRYRETHDLFHVVTGYATDADGEMELQAFILGNIGVPSAALVLFFTAPGYVKRGVKALSAYVAKLKAAYRRGKNSRDLLSVPYERFWATPVSELAAQLVAAA